MLKAWFVKHSDINTYHSWNFVLFIDYFLVVSMHAACAISADVEKAIEWAKIFRQRGEELHFFHQFIISLQFSSCFNLILGVLIIGHGFLVSSKEFILKKRWICYLVVFFLNQPLFIKNYIVLQMHTIPYFLSMLWGKCCGWIHCCWDKAATTMEQPLKRLPTGST